MSTTEQWVQRIIRVAFSVGGYSNAIREVVIADVVAAACLPGPSLLHYFVKDAG